ncbi:LuxR C-terminal-related transcriptional regulator [Knoellia aerolata]|nr:LuxR C-terminal-related transcriptional regulator [Knoellia aerolata]
MASPLVDTKLFVPRLRPGAVPRPRLDERLRRGSEVALTLVSAPAGFGKTTALASWLAGATPSDRVVAWLSLEEHDRRPISFWTYVAAALSKAVPGLDALPLVTSPQPQVETLLTTLVNELAGRASDIVLVLDDYHQVDGPEIAQGITFLLEHLPPNVHLVISTRADPALPLARLRARGELVEVRARDLRFTRQEVSEYLGVTGLELAESDAADLEARTEGWIAALQLAALSLQGRDDVSGFVAGFAGDDRYIVDYLVEEVLTRQPDTVRDFLLSTSILDRLSGPLCDAVTGHPGGRAMLETLVRSNLFVVPLDERRRWFRYHHLFADVLRAHLGDERPGDLDALHRRASQWYEAEGEAAPSVRHALAAGDVDRAARLVEEAIPTLQRARQDGTIRGWVDVIPDEVLRDRPRLAVMFAGALLSAGELDGVEQRLDDVEQRLGDAQPAGLGATLQMYRAALALRRGDSSGTFRHAQLALERAGDGDDLVRAGASALSGQASWRNGHLEAAHASYSACAEQMLRLGHVADVLACSITLADIRLTQGRLRDASATYEHALRLAGHETSPRGEVLPGTSDMLVGLSGIALERGDLPTALDHLTRSRQLGERGGLPQNPYRWRVALARVRDAQGDLQGALELLDEAQRVQNTDFSPDVQPIAAVRARLLARHGHIDDALGWVTGRGLRADDELTYLREYEHVTLARILLARHTGDDDAMAQVHDLVQRLLDSAEAGGRTGTVLELLVMQALAHHVSGDSVRARVPLERALMLAEPEDYVHLFAREGAGMVALLEAVDDHRRSPYAHRLLAACRQELDAASPPGLPVRGGGPAPTARLEEPLSVRELEVLRLLGTDLDGPGIAQHLVVSLHTVRSHTKHIYAKLGVNSRRAALTRARDLGLLPTTPTS